MVNTRTLYIPTMDIMEQAKALGDVKTFLHALKITGLDALLREKGPFTVFAPSDEAFYRLPQIAVRDMLDDRAALRDFVAFHIIPGQKVLSSDTARLQSAATLQGDNVTFNTRYGFMVNDVTASRPDIECSNGVIHVIDALLAVRGR